MATNLARRGAAPLIAAPAAAKRGKTHDRGPLTKYLAFRLADDVYGAPLSLIREILVRKPLTPVPRAHPSIMGIISNRGQLITVIDLRRRLRLAERPETNKARILTTNPMGVELLGLYVDEVLQTYDLADSDIESTTTAFGGEVAGYIAGIVRPTQVEGPSASRVGKRVPAAKQVARVMILLDLKIILSS
jgi:purine-binding chemotaxis protein CheW